MWQKVMVIGNLGKDPELRYTPNGTAVTNFSVATNRKWTNADGTPGEETVWFRVTAWSKLGENCNKYLSKGRQVFVEGTLIPDPATGAPKVWTRTDGSAGASFEIRADRVQFLGQGNGGSKAEQGPESDTSYGNEEERELPF